MARSSAAGTRGLVDLDARRLAQTLGEVQAEIEGLVRVERLHTRDLEGIAQGRAHAQEPRGGRGRRLRPHDEASGRDRRQDLIEDARRLPLMRAAHGDLQHVGDVPDEVLADAELLDRLLDAALELPEPLLTGHEVGTSGLEHAPAVALEPPRENAQERRLADACLPVDEEGAHRRLAHGRLRIVEGLGPGDGLDQDVVAFGRDPETAE